MVPGSELPGAQTVSIRLNASSIRLIVVGPVKETVSGENQATRIRVPRRS